MPPPHIRVLLSTYMSTVDLLPQLRRSSSQPPALPLITAFRKGSLPHPSSDRPPREAGGEGRISIAAQRGGEKATKSVPVLGEKPTLLPTMVS